MQSTRLNTLAAAASDRLQGIFANPWRRLALVIISFLSGFFLSSVVVASAGQQSLLDVVIAVAFLLVTEGASFYIYGRPKASAAKPPVVSPLTIALLNAFKLGVVFSLYLEACKLNT